MKACPFCAEEVQENALKCRHCGEFLTSTIQDRIDESRGIKKDFNPGIAALLSFIIPGAGQIYKGNIAGGIGWLILAVLGYICLILPGVVIHIICVVKAFSQERSE